MLEPNKGHFATAQPASTCIESLRQHTVPTWIWGVATWGVLGAVEGVAIVVLVLRTICGCSHHPDKATLQLLHDAAGTTSAMSALTGLLPA